MTKNVYLAPNMIKTKALILSAMKYRESSLILDMLTRETGRVSFIISGVRGSKTKRHAGMLQAAYWAELVAYFKPGKGLHRIKEIKPGMLYTAIPFHPTKRAVAVFCTEIIRKSSSTQEQNTALFDDLYDFFYTLDNDQGSVANYPIILLQILADHLGIKPSPSGVGLKPYFDLIEGIFVEHIPQHIHYIRAPITAHLHNFLGMQPIEAKNTKLPHTHRKALLEFWIDYFKIHIESFKEINSLSVLSDVLA